MYYYTAAALPMLVFDSTPPIQSDDFLGFCRETLSHSDALTIERMLSLDLTEPFDHPKAEEWRIFETDLRNALVDLRAKTLGWGADSRKNDFVSYEARVIAENAVGGDSPMDVEIALDTARWSFAAEMELGHYFDMDFLISYCLKLKILERRAELTYERGREAYERIYETTLESLNVGVSDGE